MSKRTTKIVKIPVSKLTAGSFEQGGVNFRDADGHDPHSMVEQIREAGRVIEPLHVLKRPDDFLVLKGNRRTFACKELLADPAIPANLKDAIESLDCIVYEDLSEREQTEIVLDHGSQKPLSRLETIKAVWRLAKQMWSEKDIITTMYQLLARYTGNVRKASEAEQLTGNARETYLHKWLHGTVGNYLLVAAALGERVRKNFLLTELAIDRKLTEDEQKELEFKVSRERVKELNTAKGEDKKNKGWDPQSGGETFNALIEKYIDEDESGTKSGTKRFTPKQMEDAADQMGPAGLFYRHCAGKLSTEEASKVEELDREITRMTRVRETIIKSLDKIADKSIKELLSTLCYGSAENVEKSLEAFCS